MRLWVNGELLAENGTVKRRLGSYYSIVQRRVNEMLS